MPLSDYVELALSKVLTANHGADIPGCRVNADQGGVADEPAFVAGDSLPNLLLGSHLHLVVQRRVNPQPRTVQVRFAELVLHLRDDVRYEVGRLPAPLYGF